MFKEWKAILKTNLYYCHDRNFSYSSSVQYHFLSSMWDPYGNCLTYLWQLSIRIKRLPIMVKHVYRKDMVSNLKENKTLDFHFVDEEG